MKTVRFSRCIRHVGLFLLVVTILTVVITRKHTYKQEHQYIYDPHHLSIMNKNQPVTEHHIQDNKTKRCNHSVINLGIQNTTNSQLKDNGTALDKTNVRRNNPSPLKTSSSQEALPPNKTNPVIVVILAYMHTGSSYTARIIQQHPGTFYEFEPLRSLQDSSRQNLPILFLNGTYRRLSGEIIAADIGSEAVRNTVTCNHQKLDMATLSTSYRGLISSDNRDTADFFKCQKEIHNTKTTSYGLHKRNLTTYFRRGHLLNSKKRILSILNHTQNQNTRNTKVFYRDQRRKLQTMRSYNKRPTKRNLIKYTSMKHKHGLKDVPLSVSIESIKTCIPRLISKCKNATIRVTKYIRMTMEMIENLLPNFENLRVIHLLRDPRSMMDSQLRKNDMSVKSLPLFVRRTRYMCMRMKNDLDVSKRLKRSYPGHIYTLRYEDLADNPVKVGQQLFRFIGVPFSLKDKQYIISTSLRTEKDSKYRAAVWRNHITAKHLQIVDKYCQKLYDELSYRRFTSILDVRNLTKPNHYIRSSIISEL